MNYVTYPCKTMRITQNYKGKTSHKPHNSGYPKDYPVDEGCANTGKDYIYCPCDEMRIRRIYGVGTKGANTIWLESTEKADFADGKRGYLTLMITHPDDSDLKNLRVGDVFKRGEKITREGKDSASANHLHISAGKGKMKGSGWMQNSKGKWVLTVTDTASKPEDIFYIDLDFTKVISSGAIKFKQLPDKFTAGYYKVDTAVLNIRLGPGTEYKKKGVIRKGKAVKITQIKNNWGKYADNNWICLDYCKFM